MLNRVTFLTEQRCNELQERKNQLAEWVVKNRQEKVLDGVEELRFLPQSMGKDH